MKVCYSKLEITALSKAQIMIETHTKRIKTFSPNHLFLTLIIYLFNALQIAEAADTLKIACVGNSITQGDWLANPATQGYVALLQTMFGNKCRVMNYGLSGRTMLSTATSSCTPYNKESKFRELFSVKPDIITIELGTNESRPSVWTSREAFEADYTKFIDTLQTITDTNSSHPHHPIIIPVLCTPATDNNSFSISGTIVANQIIPSIRKVAQTESVSTIDTYTPFLSLKNLIPDGVHPDSNGNKLLADIYYENLQNLALKQSPQTRWLWYGRPPAAGAPNAKGNTDADRPMLLMYPAPENNRNGAAVIIIPGGGYTGLPGLNNYEGVDEAKWFNTFGVSAFVLRYRFSPYRHPVEMNDAKRAVRTIRYLAASYGIDTTRIGVMGFSAGGHLASTVGTHFDMGNPGNADPIEQKKSRPDFQILIYPVITLSGPYAHTGSRDALLGTPANASLVDSLCNQKWVTAQTPQTFMAHGDADNVVPIQNSRMFDSACKVFHVADTLVVDPGKGHGYGMGGIWPEALKNWLKNRGLLDIKVAVEPRQVITQSQQKQVTLQYSRNRGIEINSGTDNAETVELFLPDGRCMGRYTGADIKTINWQPPSRGIYIAKVRTESRNTFVFRIAPLNQECN
jgi:acetyl esterase/lipase/lysophospholipase L1-like esterase